MRVYFRSLDKRRFSSDKNIIPYARRQICFFHTACSAIHGGITNNMLNIDMQVHLPTKCYLEPATLGIPNFVSCSKLTSLNKQQI